jgi:hypothetical protein
MVHIRKFIEGPNYKEELKQAEAEDQEMVDEETKYV